MSKGTGESYSRIAGEYARQFFHELEGKPLDRHLLTRLASETRGKGPVCDLGCGPGEVARFLQDHGAQACGMDLAAGMVSEAARHSPDIPFRQGDMLAIPEPDGAWAGIAAFYSLIHVTRQQIPLALGEMLRVLQPGGCLLLSFHIGEETIHLDEWWGKAVDLDFNFLLVADMQQHIRQAGFENLETWVRSPYAQGEHRSRRAYLWACRPL